MIPSLTEKSFARPSSTVILLRDAMPGPELFMVQRHADSSFGAAYAFPGGVLDTSDADAHECCAGRVAADANTVLGLESGGLDFFVAAIRELFEETGVLLASHEIPTDELELLRKYLNCESQTWNNFVHDNNVSLQCDRLHYFSHWITPEQLAKRYSTRFFVAKLPAGQTASHDERELTNSKWITAANALQAGENGLMTLYYPTRKTLENIAQHHSVAELLAWASDCEARGVETTRPVIPDASQ
jgi:8-oxo-dGTP pyrophosphatase MutT (NUDIX family)